jgi:hypothetical protein
VVVHAVVVSPCAACASAAWLGPGFWDALYSKWFRSVIKDESLAAEAEQIERRGGPESRGRIREAIAKRYTTLE